MGHEYWNKLSCLNLIKSLPFNYEEGVLENVWKRETKLRETVIFLILESLLNEKKIVKKMNSIFFLFFIKNNLKNNEENGGKLGEKKL